MGSHNAYTALHQHHMVAAAAGAAASAAVGLVEHHALKLGLEPAGAAAHTHQEQQGSAAADMEPVRLPS
jgi:hypothetical protein